MVPQSSLVTIHKELAKQSKESSAEENVQMTPTKQSTVLPQITTKLFITPKVLPTVGEKTVPFTLKLLVTILQR